MRINYLSPRGRLEVEHATLHELEAKLPSAWGAYAAIRLLTRGSKQPLDIDLLLLTTNRILVVELKNWSGDIEYSSGQWFHRGAPMPSPVDTTDNKARALKTFIREKNASITIPFIETLVVLCHPKCRLINFPGEQRRFVTTLPDFMHAASDANCYKKRFPDTPPNWAYRSADPLLDRQPYNDIFTTANPAVLKRRTVLHGFEQIEDRADCVHPRKIWSEFLAGHQESRSSKALLRKWNFEELGAGGASTVEHQTIGLRELRLNETLRVQAPELHEDLLEPIGSATADDITTNFVEAYRLPTGIERLAEHMSRNADMSEQDRRSMAKSILARFAKLHALGIAHRDITHLISDEEMGKLFRHFDKVEAEGLEHAVISLAIRLQFEFAGRRSEIVLLEWDWVDLEHRRVVWPDSKTGGMSKPMSEEAYQLLSAAPRQEGCSYVLRSPRDPMNHLTTGEYYGGWSRRLKAAGVTHVGTHGIRHRSATDIANSGIPVKVGMMLTAHKTVAMFMRYVHKEDAPLRAAAELVANRRKNVVDAQRKPLQEVTA